MNEKLLTSLAEIAREYPGSIETILKIAYASGRFDGTYQPPRQSTSRYTQAEQPEMVRTR